MIKDETLPWQVYVITGIQWSLHSSYERRSSAEDCIRLVHKFAPDINMVVAQGQPETASAINNN